MRRLHAVRLSSIIAILAIEIRDWFSAMRRFRTEGCDAGGRRSPITFAAMTRERQTMGKRGEAVAARWLKVHGWSIAEQRFQNGHRDIDLIATRGEPDQGRTVAFVEVKTRKSEDFGGPVSAVNWRKQRELTRSAKVWMSRFQRPGDSFRFDVIGVILGSETIRVQHVENAFLVSNKS